MHLLELYVTLLCLLFGFWCAKLTGCAALYLILELVE